MFYIYAYLRQDGTPYYIGKGKRDRYKSKNHSIFVPNESHIVIMESNLTEIGAFALERFYIRWYGRKDNNTGILRNLTDGGEGTSGYSLSEDTKKLISLSKLGKIRPQNVKDAISKGKIGKTRAARTEEWKKNNGESRARKWIITFPDGHIETILNMAKFCREYNLQFSLLHNTVTGKRKHHKGFSLQRSNEHEDTTGQCF